MCYETAVNATLTKLVINQTVNTQKKDWLKW